MLLRKRQLSLLAAFALFGCGTPEPPSDGAGGSATGGAPSGGTSGATSGGSATGGAPPGSAGVAGAPLGGTSGSATGGAAGSGAAGSSGATAGGGRTDAGSGGGGSPAGGASGAGAGGVAGSGGSGAGGSGGVGGSAGSVTDPGTQGDGDFTIDSPFTPAREGTVPSGVPRGTLHPSVMLPSSGSTVYPTNVANGQTFNRQMQVYVPNGYAANTEAPFMIVQDGSGYVNRLRPVLDNLIAENRLPKLVVVFLNPGPGDGPGSQRGLEYDTVSERYTTFIESEILPKVAADYDVRFTTNPEGRGSFGCSSGGAAAFTMGWFHPELYRRIITYSGTFTNQASSAMYPHGAWGYHETLIPESDPKPLRVFLEVGSNDNGSTSPASGYRNWVLANQGMARELDAKNYHYRFVFANGAGHCDGGVFGQTLPETMEWAWRGYPR
ncbi:MAG TPA: alpha/beta hydrolase-fold protein [Polyangiaceae bacterium]